MVVLALLLAACGGGEAMPATTAGAGGVVTPRVEGNLTIFAAASLTDAFNELKARIERATPGATITYQFAASSTLRQQLEQGAGADLFASADQPQMDAAKRGGAIAGDERVFAQNKLVIIVPADNPRGIAASQDLAKPGVKLVLTNSQVPIGAYAREALGKMAGDSAFDAGFAGRVLANLVSEEPNVRQVVAKVQLGEGDAGIVYSSDVTPAVRGQLRAIPIPDQFNVIARYPIAVVRGAANEAGARAFIDYLLSAEGQAILEQNGFIPVGRTGGAPPYPLAGAGARPDARRRQ